MYNIGTLNKISPAGLSKLSQNYQLVDDLSSACGILVRSQDMHSMDLSENLLGIARAGAGVNNIPIDRCAEQGTVVFNAPGANANAVKELVLSSMILSARNIHHALQWTADLKGQDDIGPKVEKGKSQFAGNEIQGKTLGVIGLGAIGVSVANAAEKLGMKVIGNDPFMTLKAAHNLSNTIEIVRTLEEVLPRCDYITVHVPFNDNTKEMINTKTLSLVKDGVVFLNFSRDKLVVDADMLAALDSGKVKRYITDFPNDAVLGHESVIPMPHIGASTEEAEDNCAIMATNQLMDLIENGNIVNSVNYPECSLGELHGTRICVLNRNIPAMLSAITKSVSDLNLNINNLLNKSKGDFACTLLDIDGDVSADTIVETLSQVDGIIRVRVLTK